LPSFFEGFSHKSHLLIHPPKAAFPHTGRAAFSFFHLSSDFRSGCRFQKFAVLHAAGADQYVRNVGDVGAFPFHNDHFQAVVVIQVDVGGGDDVPEETVLDPIQFFGELPGVMAVNKAENAYGRFIPVLPFLPDQLFPHEITEGFGAASVSFPLNERIELIQQVRFDGDAKTGHMIFSGFPVFFHGRISFSAE